MSLTLSVLRAPLFVQKLKSLQLNNSPGDWARELFKPSTDSPSLKPQMEKKFFVLDFGFSRDDVNSGSVLESFWPNLPGRRPQPNQPIPWLKKFSETRSKSVSLEPLNGFLAYLYL